MMVRRLVDRVPAPEQLFPVTRAQAERLEWILDQLQSGTGPLAVRVADWMVD